MYYLETMPVRWSPASWSQYNELGMGGGAGPGTSPKLSQLEPFSGKLQLEMMERERGKGRQRNRDMKLPFPWSCLMINSRMNEVPLYPCSWAP